MRTIKFRGKDIKTGEVVYGDYVSPWELKNPQIRVTTDYCKDELGCVSAICRYCEVDPRSVRQFVGVDKNGREIYEGDQLKNDRDGTIIRAELKHVDTSAFVAWR